MNAVVTFYAFKNDFSRDQEKESRCAFPHHAVSCCEPSAHHHTPAVFPRWCLTVGEKQWKGMAEGRPGARDEANKVDPSFTQRISSEFVDIFSISVKGHSVHTLAIARPSPTPLPVPHTNTITAGQAPQPLALAPAPTLLPAAPPPDAACSLPSAVTKNNPRAHQQPRLGASGSGLELTL